MDDGINCQSHISCLLFAHPHFDCFLRPSAWSTMVCLIHILFTMILIVFYFKVKKVNLVLPSRYVDTNKNPKIKKSRSSADCAESTNNDLLRDICKSKQQLILLNVFTKSYIVCNLIQLGYHRRREIRESESIHRAVGIYGDKGGGGFYSPTYF